MMEETLHICERAQRSTQDASHRKTFPFGLRPSSDTYARQATKSIQIQSGRQQPSGDIKNELAPAATHSTYCAPTKRAHGTLSMAAGYGRRLTRSATPHALHELPRLQTSASSRRPESTSHPTTKDPPGGASWWFRRTTHRGSVRHIPRRHVGSKPTRTAPRGGRSSARRYPRAPATYASSLKRQDCRRSTAPRPT
jgi:hypothetical protein